MDTIESIGSPLISIEGSSSPEIEGFVDNSFYREESSSPSADESTARVDQSDESDESDESEEETAMEEEFEQVDGNGEVPVMAVNPLGDQFLIESQDFDLFYNEQDVIMQDEPIFAVEDDEQQVEEGFYQGEDDFEVQQVYETEEGYEAEAIYESEEGYEVEETYQAGTEEGCEIEEVYEAEAMYETEEDCEVEKTYQAEAMYETEEGYKAAEGYELGGDYEAEEGGQYEEGSEYEYEYEECDEYEEEEDNANKSNIVPVSRESLDTYDDCEPAGETYHNLETYTPNATREDRAKRSETLQKQNLFFTKEAYNHFTLFTPNSSEYCELYDLIEKAQAAHKKGLKNIKRGIIEEEEEQELPIAKKPKLDPPATTVLDNVLTDMLRHNQQYTAAAQESSDLEIAAMAAGLVPDSLAQGVSNKSQSRYTKEQHINFLRISNDVKSGSTTVSEADLELYKAMCLELKVEQDEFIKVQRKNVYNSGIYNTLDEKVDKMVQNYYQLEYTRLLKYPQFYKYFNILNMPPQNVTAADTPILSFKKSLLQVGKIATCKPSMLESPRRLDLFKKYFYMPKEEDQVETVEDDGEDKYYRKKLPPTVSSDKNIASLMEDNKPDIVISSESLISFLELVNDVSSNLCVPITVVEKDNVKTLIFDRPLPREAMSARERNKLIYDLTFKSLCLDWTKRHNITTTPEVNSETTLVDEKKPELTSANADDDWDNVQNENLQYNLWTFGEMNILIRHQADGEYIGNSKERRVCLTSKLDYQISNGLEEITTPSDRAKNWLRSYIEGHATVLEGRIDVVNNRLVRVDRKEMVDIMGAQWRPMHESELLRHTFSKLHKILSLPGKYLLQHKKDDRNFLIYQSIQDGMPLSWDIDLYKKFSSKNPILTNPETSFIPAWTTIENQIPWTFPPKE